MIRSRRCARAGTAVFGKVAVVVAALGLTGGLTGDAEAQILGTADSFGVLAAPPSPTPARASFRAMSASRQAARSWAFPPAWCGDRNIHAADAVAAQAQVDLTTAYNTLQGLPSQVNLTGQNLGGMTSPGRLQFRDFRSADGGAHAQWPGQSVPLSGSSKSGARSRLPAIRWSC